MRAALVATVLVAEVVSASLARAEEPTRPLPPNLETVVSARPDPASAPREDKAAAASVVLPDDSPRAYDDLGSLLLEVPGVTVTRTGSLGAFATLTLRGANPDEVRVYLDGVPLNIAAGGAVDISTLPLGDVERVEVYRGTTPIAFGESALGGIVSITTRTPGTTGATARAGMGSFGTAFGDVTAGGRLGRVRLYLGAHGFSAAGDYPYNNDMGTPLNPSDDVYGPRRNNDVLQGDGVIRLALTLSGRRTLSLGALGFARDQGLSGPGSSPTQFARFATMRGLGTLRYESRDDLGPGGRLSAELFASEQRDQLRDMNNELGLGAALRHETTRSVGAAAHGSRPFGEWGRGTIVLEGRRETYAPEDDLATVPEGIPARRLVGVAGGEIDLRWRRLDLDLIPSVRVEATEDAVSKRDTVGVPVAGAPAVGRALPVWRLGLVRPIGSLVTLKANVGKYGRVPSFLELYGNATGRLLGNPDLLPERGTNADLGLSIDRRGDRVAVASHTTLFGALVDDLIQWQSTSWGVARPGNLASARIWGVEEELRLRAGHRVRVTGQITYLVAEDRSDNVARRGKQLPLYPRVHAYARPELVRISLPGGLELGAYADGDLRGETWVDPAHLGRVGPRLLLGAGVSVGRPKNGLRLTASAVNLTGTRLEDFTDWSLPGRSVLLALAYVPGGSEDDSGANRLFDPRYGP